MKFNRSTYVVIFAAIWFSGCGQNFGIGVTSPAQKDPGLRYPGSPYLLKRGRVSEEILPEFDAGGPIKRDGKRLPAPAPVRFELEGKLPEGLAFDTETGAITGVPKLPLDSTPYRISVVDTYGKTSITRLVLAVEGDQPQGLQYPQGQYLLPTDQPFGPVSPSLSNPETVDLSNEYSAEPALPPGLTLDAKTGAISGVPSSQSSSRDYVISVTNPKGSSQAILQIGVVAPISGLRYGQDSFVFKVNQAAGPSAALRPVYDSTGGAPVKYSISPKLPAGLSLNPTTGAISGTPSIVSSEQAFQVTAYNLLNQPAQTTVTIRVIAELAAFSYSPSSALLKQNRAIASGSELRPSIQSTPGNPLAFQISPALNNGLSFSSLTGVISGTPTVAHGEQVFTVTAKDLLGELRSTQLRIQVLAPLAGLSYGSQPLAFKIHHPIPADAIPKPSLAPSSGIPSLFEISPALPAGLQFNPLTGEITGAPTELLSATTFTVTASDALGDRVTTTFVLSVFEELRTYQISAETDQVVPNVNVALIVDNSASMEPHQDKLSSGIRSMVDALRGFNVNFHVYTTTPTYPGDAARDGTSSHKATVRPIQSFLYTDSSGKEVSSATLPSWAQDEYSEVTNLRLNPSFTGGTPLKLTAGMTTSKFSDVRQKLVDAIRGVGVDGDDREQGLCSAAQVLLGDPDHNIFASGTRAAFIFLSDEDDQSYDSLNQSSKKGNFDLGCVKKRRIDYSQKNKKYVHYRSSVTYSPADPAYRVNLSYRPGAIGEKVTCYGDDNVPYPCTVTEDMVFEKVFTINTPISGLSCGSGCLGKLSAALSAVGWSPDSKYEFLSCKYSCISLRNSSCSMKEFAIDRLDRDYCSEPLNSNNPLYGLCQPDTGPKTLAFKSCSREEVQDGKSSTTQVESSLSSGASGLADAIVRRANATFGPDGYIMSAIVHQKDPRTNSACQGISHGSVGTRYIDLINKRNQSVSGKGGVYSICSGDYSMALEPIRDFIQNVTVDTYRIDLEPGEEIRGVTVTRDGKLIGLSSTAYTINGSEIKFSSGVLLPGDQIAVKILVP